MTDPLPLLGGKLLWHPAATRSTEDAFWLAAAVSPCAVGAPVLDMGCGNGAVLLALWLRQPQILPFGLDRDADQLAQANQNAQLNCCPATFIQADVHTLPAAPRYAVVVSNPPFHARSRGHHTPDARKALAHGLPESGLAPWLEAIRGQLLPGGRAYLVLHQQLKRELVNLVRPYGGLIMTLPLQSHPERPAKRVLVSWRPEPGSFLRHQPLAPLASHDPELRTAVLKTGAALTNLPPAW